MNVKYIIVLITSPNVETSEQIANALLDQKLAACVNVSSRVTSLYTWEGEVNRDEEMLLIVKSGSLEEARDEVRLASRLGFPGIVRYRDACMDEETKRPCVVMEPFSNTARSSDRSTRTALTRASWCATGTSVS